MKEKKPTSNLIECCKLTNKTIELFNEEFLVYGNTNRRNNIFVYWNFTDLNKKRRVDCDKKWDKEWSKLQKDKSKKFEKKREGEKIEWEKKYQEEAKKRGVINCFYSHFKNTTKKLKIVCDWDEVIQSLEPKVYYELSEREGAYYDAPWWMPNGTKFAEWFQNFWLNPPIYYSDYGSHSVYSDKSMVNSCIGKKVGKSITYGLGQRTVKSKIDKIKNEPDFYENSPFLTLAKELLKLVKENKVEVIFLSAYDKRAFSDGDPRKKKIFGETFGKFPNCSLNLLGFDSEMQSGNTSVVGDQGQGQKKSEWIEKNVPNCEVVIDDNPNILGEIIENNDKVIAVAPFYPAIKHHEKVLLVKTSISDLKKDDFKHE